jgi:hypothetical protein
MSPQLLFFCVVLEFELRAYTLNHSTNLFFFCEGVFWDRVLQIICLDWLQTSILLISTSWVAVALHLESHSSGCQLDCYLMRYLQLGTQLSYTQIPHTQNCEITNFCCFKPLNFGIIWDTAIKYQRWFLPPLKNLPLPACLLISYIVKLHLNSCLQFPSTSLPFWREECSAKSQMQVLIRARQGLYHWATPPAPLPYIFSPQFFFFNFCLVCFLFLRTGLYSSF